MSKSFLPLTKSAHEVFPEVLNVRYLFLSIYLFISQHRITLYFRSGEEGMGVLPTFIHSYVFLKSFFVSCKVEQNLNPAIFNIKKAHGDHELSASTIQF